MAKVNDVRQEWRDIARKVPEDILGKLTVGELNARCEYAAKLEEDAALIVHPETSNAALSRAKRVLGAKPILEYHEAVKRHNEALGYLPGTGLEALAVRADHNEAKEKLAEDNPFPPELQRVVEAELAHGKAPEDINLDELLGAEVVKANRRSVSRRDGFCPWCDAELWRHEAAEHYRKHEKDDAKADVRAKVAKAMADWQADHNARVEALRKEIAAFQRQHERARGKR